MALLRILDFVSKELLRTFFRLRIKRGNWEGGNWDFVDLVNLFNSAEIYKNAGRNQETKRRSLRLRPTGALCAPVVGFFDSPCVFVYFS